jgi:hypothetical protein
MDGPLLLLIIIIVASSPSSSSSTLLTGSPLTAAVLELRLVGEMMPLLLLLLSASTVTGSVSVEIVR